MKIGDGLQASSVTQQKLRMACRFDTASRSGGPIVDLPYRQAGYAPKRVLAAVVTHNRRDLLSRCLDHIEAQSRASEGLVVINNSSTDGTLAMLEARCVPVITQANVGSAGGWHRAIEHALEHDYDAIWLMDDDGFPDPQALALLIDAWSSDMVCASSVVVREDCTDRFVFPFPVLSKGTKIPKIWAFPRKISTLLDLEPMAPNGTYPFAHLFNGALISLTAVRRIGNVNRGFFMFGEEVDYFYRLRSAGQVCSVLEARHYHPDVTQRPLGTAKVYFYIKNSLILNARYHNAVWLRHVLTLVAALWRTRQRNGWREMLSYLVGRNAHLLRRAVDRGLRGNVGNDLDE